MTFEEKQTFITFLFAHRHLWMTFQEFRYLQEHPEADWETAHEIFHEESQDVYQSVADALLEGRPIQDSLQTVLTQSGLTQVEVEQMMKNR